MFCLYAIIALIFISHALCYAPSHACFVCILLFSAFIMRAYAFRLHALVDPFIANWCATLTQAFICSSMCASPLRRLSFALGKFILIYFVILGTVCVCTGVFAY
jgi:hypothetical protein